MLHFTDIIHIAEGKVLQDQGDSVVSHLLLDSRKIYAPESSLFFAIAGERHDGHKYLQYLYERGVRQFVIERITSLEEMPLANVFIVKSSLVALQSIAAQHRAQFQYPVIAITGSNGKTIVKEWLAQMLAKDFQIVRSPRSYNSQIGVPLSVWAMQEQHTLGIFEAGISKPLEMAQLQKIINPTLGIFTNIGSAHAEGFENISHKIKEKLILFKGVQTLIYCADHEQLVREIEKQSYNKFTWSLLGHVADVHISIIGQQANSTLVNITFEDVTTNLMIPFTDEASVENALQCVACLVYMKIDSAEIAIRLSQLQPVAMRLELKQGVQGSYLIDDSYNNDLAGLTIALNFLAQQNQTPKKSLILSDMLETAIAPEVLYLQVAALVKAKGIGRFVGVGRAIAQYAHFFENASFYPTTEAFLSGHLLTDFNHETILIKGARVFLFEKIVNALQEKVHGTVLEVNLDALSHNLNYFKSLLQPQTKIMVMVKAFAYGSGSYEVANLLQFHRVDYLGVAYTDEGVDLRTHGIALPIMVMNPSSSSFAKMHAHHLEPEIYSFKILHDYLDFLRQNQVTQAKIHLKIDTGMHRLGFEEGDIAELILLLNSSPELHVASIFSHLAGADEATHNDYSQLQLSLFESIAKQIETAIGYSTIKHILNSAGIMRFTAHQHDMVRLGIGLYGVDATALRQAQLQTVGKLKAIISQIKTVDAGQTVGYSRRGIVHKQMRIATISIGYADGYDRRFSSGVGKIWVNGTLCPVIGNVCMDMTMIDITQATAAEGEEVEVFGNHISILDMATSIGTIPYEILTNVSGRVKRIFYSE